MSPTPSVGGGWHEKGMRDRDKKIQNMALTNTLKLAISHLGN